MKTLLFARAVLVLAVAVVIMWRTGHSGAPGDT